MGGIPKVHASSDEQELGVYNLNLTPDQLDEVARKLQIPADSEYRARLVAGGPRQPSDGQRVMLTFKGRYVRITYQEGRATTITTPAD